MINNKKRLLYIGIGLDEYSSETIKKLGEEIINSKAITNFEPKYFCHHMTVSFYKNLNDKILEWARENKGKEFTMNVTGIGFSDKAIAVKVETNAPTTSNFKHITIATNLLTNGKPFDSNNIENWFTIKGLFSLKGTLQFYYN